MMLMSIYARQCVPTENESIQRAAAGFGTQALEVMVILYMATVYKDLEMDVTAEELIMKMEMCAHIYR